MRKLFMENGSLSYRGIGAGNHRQQVEAGLVGEEDGPTLLQRPLFNLGQVLCFQSSMALSSRWIARRVGFCEERPRDFASRLTCAE